MSATDLLEFHDIFSSGHERLVKVIPLEDFKVLPTITGQSNALELLNIIPLNVLLAATDQSNSTELLKLIPLYVKDGLLEARTKDGDTALTLAKSFDHKGCEKILIAARHQVPQEKEVCCAIL